MKSELLKIGHNYYMLFLIGINTGLRLRNILTLKAADVRNKSIITIYEQKTGKTKHFEIYNGIQNEIDQYIRDMDDDTYIFRSKGSKNKPMTKIEASRILNIAGEKLGLGTTGTHTMRKTFGFHHYREYEDVKLLQELFNQSAPCVTLSYIGITRDTTN